MRLGWEHAWAQRHAHKEREHEREREREHVQSHQRALECTSDCSSTGALRSNGAQRERVGSVEDREEDRERASERDTYDAQCWRSERQAQRPCA